MKVLLLAKSVSSVRIPIYNEIARHCDFTIVYSEGDFPDGAHFTYQKIEERKIRTFRMYKTNLYRLAKRFDVLIAPLSYVNIDVLGLLFLKKPCKIILWGIGVRASYIVRFDEPSCKNSLPKLFPKADALLFYSDYPKKKYMEMGYDGGGMFVANNTVTVNAADISHEKDSILFVGSLYPQKKVMELLKAYTEVYKRHPDVYKLNIIGKGSEEEELRAFIRENHMEDKVTMPGAIYDDDALEPYFLSAHACISPDQAGLSVLKSMGYGVPFVTTKNAFTGGERLNISDGENGVLMENLSELPQLLESIYRNPEKFRQLGEAAYDYYWEERRPEQMAEGFLKAIHYTGDER